MKRVLKDGKTRLYERAEMKSLELREIITTAANVKPGMIIRCSEA